MCSFIFVMHDSWVRVKAGIKVKVSVIFHNANNPHPRHFLVLSYNHVRLSAFQFVSSSLLDAFRKRLLVPGAITLDIIEVYILTIKVHELGAVTSAHPYWDAW